MGIDWYHVQFGTTKISSLYSYERATMSTTLKMIIQHNSKINCTYVILITILTKSERFYWMYYSVSHYQGRAGSCQLQINHTGQSVDWPPKDTILLMLAHQGTVHSHISIKIANGIKNHKVTISLPTFQVILEYDWTFGTSAISEGWA